MAPEVVAAAADRAGGDDEADGAAHRSNRIIGTGRWDRRLRQITCAILCASSRTGGAAMKRWILVLTVVSLVSVGCEDPRKQAIEKIDADAEVMGRVSTAVNEVIRNSTDCDVAKPLLTEAYQRIDEARGRIRVAASRQTLEMMKVQVDRVARMLPVADRCSRLRPETEVAMRRRMRRIPRACSRARRAARCRRDAPRPERPVAVPHRPGRLRRGARLGEIGPRRRRAGRRPAHLGHRRARGARGARLVLAGGERAARRCGASGSSSTSARPSTGRASS